MTDDAASKHREQKKFDRLLDRLQAKLPDRLARMVAWLVSPSAILVRLPLGLLFILGGVFSFLPVLGIWMLPLGILLVAVDVPPLRRRVVQVWPKIEARWRLRALRKRQQMTGSQVAAPMKATDMRGGLTILNRAISGVSA